jgi:hypothetical protein
MPDESVPAELRTFVLRYIDSVGQLESLLLLRADPSARWTPATLAPRLYTTEEEASAILTRLADDGFLIAEETGYRFQCTDDPLERTLGELATFYATHLIAVTNLIHSKPRRIREFADAFKLKKDR